MSLTFGKGGGGHAGWDKIPSIGLVWFEGSPKMSREVDVLRHLILEKRCQGKLENSFPVKHGNLDQPALSPQVSTIMYIVQLN